MFSEKAVQKELEQYRAKGPSRTSRMLVRALQKEGVAGRTLLDIGGGVGAIQHDLMGAGVQQVTSVDASQAYIQAARAESQRRSLADRVRYLHGDFVELAEDIPPADIVTLDRVLCCYDDMENLVHSSARRARRLYGLVYPRDTWWIRLGVSLLNSFMRLRRSSYRGFVHPSRQVDKILTDSGFRQKFYKQTLIWQVTVYGKAG